MDGPTHGREPGPGELVGRADERDLVGRLLDDALAGRGGSLLVVGEPGIGKTSLLRWAVARWPGRVVPAIGMQAEATLAYAAARDLLAPLTGLLGGLPAVQREALEHALALGAGAGGGTLAAHAGALSLLATSADSEPLLVVVDDLQWLDPESLALVGFVARRVGSERVAVLLAAREGPDLRGVLGLPVLRLTGLALDDAVRLAAAVDPAVPPERVRDLVAATGGNPLALVELLGRGMTRGRGGAAGPVAAGPAVVAAWRDVLDRLPARTREALFVVAVSGAAGLPDAGDVLRAARLDAVDLEPALQQDLVRVDGGTPRLRHPLLVDVVTSLTPVRVRRRTFAALSRRADPDLRPWYRAVDVAGPDDGLAAELAAVADRLRTRGAHASAGVAGHRAAELTSDQALRVRRLGDAAVDAFVAGRLEASAQWSEEAVPAAVDVQTLAGLVLVNGRAATWAGKPDEAAARLAAEADRLVAVAPVHAATLHIEASMPHAMAGRARAASAAVERGSSLVPLAELPWPTRVIAYVGLSLTDACRPGPDALLPPHDLSDLDRTGVVQAGISQAQALCWWEMLVEGRRAINAAIDAMRADGAPALLPFALCSRSEIGFRDGGWAGAYADAVEAVAWAEELGQVGIRGYGIVCAARVEAARGWVDHCRARVDLLDREVAPLGLNCLHVHAQAALGLSALTVGRPDTAVEHLGLAWTMVLRLGPDNPDVVPFAGDHAEALARVGRTAEAVDVLVRLEESAARSDAVYPEAAAARVRGVLADDPDEAAAHFARARAAHARREWPFERARTLLAEGEVLRRARRVDAARRALREARTVFDTLDARPWAARATRELVAAGGDRDVPVDPPSAPSVSSLTPQELQVARLVATGHSNAEVAASLFLSRKTVEAHLSRAYRKLGIRSRTQLTRVLVSAGITD